MSKNLHNPKSHAPAIYIPCWLSQIQNSELKYQSKLVYGRLAQWSTNEGKAHRSAPQLSEELGMPIRTVERCLMELREKKLIGCFQPIDGGHNHFEFYDHEWMHRPINKHLCYVNSNKTPPAQLAVPPAQLAVPPAQLAVHKIKEIKEIKEIKDIPASAKTGNKKVIRDYEKDERFMKFYTEYPKKEDPRDAWKAFKSIVADNDLLLERILVDINLRKSIHTKWQDRQYIKYPAVYLRKGEYLGEIYNAEQEQADRRTKDAELARERALKQEAASIKRAEQTNVNNIQKISDAQSYRGLAQKEPSQNTKNALSGLRKILR